MNATLDTFCDCAILAIRNGFGESRDCLPTCSGPGVTAPAATMLHLARSEVAVARHIDKWRHSADIQHSHSTSSTRDNTYSPEFLSLATSPLEQKRQNIIIEPMERNDRP